MTRDSLSTYNVNRLNTKTFVNELMNIIRQKLGFVNGVGGYKYHEENFLVLMTFVIEHVGEY